LNEHHVQWLGGVQTKPGGEGGAGKKRKGVGGGGGDGSSGQSGRKKTSFTSTQGTKDSNRERKGEKKDGGVRRPYGTINIGSDRKTRLNKRGPCREKNTTRGAIGEQGDEKGKKKGLHERLEFKHFPGGGEKKGG